MPVLEWTAGLSTGIADMDYQHRKLLEILNRLNVILSSRHDRSIIEPLLKELDEYTVIHFNDEEQLMQEMNYPEIETHHEEHVNFALRLEKIKEKYSNSREDVSVELMGELWIWLTEHIMQSDQKYAGHLRESAAQ